MSTVKRIKTLAKYRGIKLTYICTQLGLSSRTYFNDIEKNGRTIPEDKLIIIANILNTTPEYLKCETNQIEKPTKENIELPEIIYKFYDLSEERKQEVLDFIEFKVYQQENDFNS